MPGDVKFPKALNSTVEIIKPQRRQNTSCDRCRRSKRRCIVSPNPDGTSDKICANCKRLGHQCTFEFAKSQLSSASKKRRKRQQSHQDESPQQAGLSEYDNIIVGVNCGSINQFDTSFVADQDILSSWLNLDFDDYLGDTTSLTPYVEPSTPSTEPWFNQTPTANTGLEHQLTLQPTGLPMTQARGFSPVNPRIGLSFHSPIYLLNSGMDAKILGDRLTRIYDAIATATASRFLDYDCNPYASKNRYRIGDSESGSSNGSAPARSSVGPHDPVCVVGSSKPTHDEVGQEISLLGSVRFLDHFGDLYGNRLDSIARKKSDEALKAVLRVFSMQWLPSTPSADESVFQTNGLNQRGNGDSLDSFIDAWVQARSLLHDAHYVCSFRVILATLTFVGIATPTKIIDKEGPRPTSLLDTGLRKLCHLDRLVTDYCTNLGSSSIYASLAETSLSIIRWAGYIRDTGAALSMDHKPKLPNQWGPAKGSTNKESMANLAACHNILELDMNVQEICRKASSETMCIWRQIINIKTTVNQPPTTLNDQSASVIQAIELAIAAIDDFNQSYQPFMANCIKNFSCLSTCPRISIVSHAMFWNLGILLLVDTFQDVSTYLDDASRQQKSRVIRQYQHNAANSVAKVVECVLGLPAEEVFNLQNGLGADVPITAYHVTPSLAVTALQKAIGSVISIQLHWANQSELGSGGGQILAPDGIWDRQVDILMKGLMSLDVTIGGSQTCGMALRELMQKYGDILSECWTSGFET